MHAYHAGAMNDANRQRAQRVRDLADKLVAERNGKAKRHP